MFGNAACKAEMTLLKEQSFFRYNRENVLSKQTKLKKFSL